MLLRASIALVALMSLTACKGDSAKAKDTDTAGSAAKPADKPEDKAADPPAPAPVTEADYDARATAMLDKTLAAFASAGDCSTAAAAVGNACDCDKAAASVSAFVRESKAEVDALRAFEASNVAAKQRFTTVNKPKLDELTEASDRLLMESCRDNKAMQDLLKSMD